MATQSSCEEKQKPQQVRALLRAAAVLPLQALPTTTVPACQVLLSEAKPKHQALLSAIKQPGQVLSPKAASLHQALFSVSTHPAAVHLRQAPLFAVKQPFQALPSGALQPGQVLFPATAHLVQAQCSIRVPSRQAVPSKVVPLSQALLSVATPLRQALSSAAMLPSKDRLFAAPLLLLGGLARVLLLPLGWPYRGLSSRATQARLILRSYALPHSLILLSR
ncbi:hypothetical protein CB1_002017001 [Camelus ferus]|nr:hypothetical protein CB1_002017001 [Camelus ferus]